MFFCKRRSLVCLCSYPYPQDPSVGTFEARKLSVLLALDMARDTRCFH